MGDARQFHRARRFPHRRPGVSVLEVQPRGVLVQPSGKAKAPRARWVADVREKLAKTADTVEVAIICRKGREPGCYLVLQPVELSLLPPGGDDRIWIEADVQFL